MNRDKLNQSGLVQDKNDGNDQDNYSKQKGLVNDMPELLTHN